MPSLRRLPLAFVLLLALLAALASLDVRAEVTFERDRVSIETQAGQTYDFDVELAVTPQQHGHGLMFREQMPIDSGMLFLFHDNAPRSFWMRNTLITLDILFIQEDGTIANIARRTTPLSEASIPSAGPVTGVLEVNGGVTRMLNINPGDRVVHPAFE